MSIVEHSPVQNNEYVVTRTMRNGPPKEIVYTHDPRLLERPERIHFHYLKAARDMSRKSETPVYNAWLDRSNIELHKYLEVARTPDAEVRPDTTEIIWNTLLGLNRGIVQKFGSYYARTEGADPDDSAQNAQIGFMKAVNTWNPKKGSLAHHANLHIRTEVQRDRLHVLDGRMAAAGYDVDLTPTGEEFERMGETDKRLELVEDRLSPDTVFQAVDAQAAALTTDETPVNQRVFKLHIRGLDTAEIAEQLGSTKSVVSKRLNGVLSRIAEPEPTPKPEVITSQADIHRASAERVLERTHATVMVGNERVDFAFIDADESMFVVRVDGQSVAARPAYDRQGRVTAIQYQLAHGESVVNVPKAFPQPIQKGTMFQSIIRTASRLISQEFPESTEHVGDNALIAQDMSQTVATLDNLKRADAVPDHERTKRSIIDLKKGRIRVGMHIRPGTEEGLESAIQSFEVIRPGHNPATPSEQRMLIWTPDTKIHKGTKHKYHAVRVIETPGQVTVESSSFKLRPDEYTKSVLYATDHMRTATTNEIAQEGTLPNGSPLLTDHMQWSRTDKHVWSTLYGI